MRQTQDSSTDDKVLSRY